MTPADLAESLSHARKTAHRLDVRAGTEKDESLRDLICDGANAIVELSMLVTPPPGPTTLVECQRPAFWKPGPTTDAAWERVWGVAEPRPIYLAGHHSRAHQFEVSTKGVAAMKAELADVLANARRAAFEEAVEVCRRAIGSLSGYTRENTAGCLLDLPERIAALSSGPSGPGAATRGEG